MPLVLTASAATMASGAAWHAPDVSRSVGAIDVAGRRVVVSDSARDSALTIGTLPNGMRYYLRVNKAPARRAEFRLAVNAGSVLEDDDQRGFAHFLEHMAFNGTTHFPHAALVDFIETSGMRFGADLNAYTSQDETVYMFTLPTDDPRLVDRGLQVLQDWASGGIEIDSSEVVAERGVVMGEWRMRLPDTASQTILSHYDSVWFGDSRYVRRRPIGDTTLLQSAEAPPIRRFYHDWYRPDLMAVVVVGDFDKARMEREIRRRFGTIPMPAHPRPRMLPTVPAGSTTAVDVYRGRVIPAVEVLWPAPLQPRDRQTAVRQELTQRLILQEVQQRILAIQRQPSRPFIVANLEAGRIVRSLDLRGVELIAWPDSLERGLRVVLTELEQIAQHGIPGAALARQKQILLTRLEHQAAQGGALSSSALADQYVEHYLTGHGLLLSPQQKLTVARAVLPTITSGAIAQAAQFWRESSGRRVHVRLPEFAHVRSPTRESMIALLDSVAHTPLAPDTTFNPASSPFLEHPPIAGRITSEKRDDVAGVTEWTLSNGAHVIVKPTTNDPDELLIRAWSPGGFSVMPDTLFFTPGRMVAKLMTDAAGLGSHGHAAIEQQLAATGLRDLRVHIGYADESINLAGSPRDLELLFQLLHLQFTAPRLDTAAIHSWASLAKYQGSGFSLNDQFDQWFARGEPRLLPVSTQLAEMVNVHQAMAVYEDRFGNAGDFTFILVGAITPGEVRPLVERYIASLPSRGKREHARAPEARPFLGNVDRTLKTLELPKSQTLLVFDGPFPSDPDAYLRARQELGALTNVLRNRIRTRIREQLGGSYSPSIFAMTYALPDERYRVFINFDSAPDRMWGLYQELSAILDSVRATGATPDELSRAATVARRQHETELQRNAYWMRTIGVFHRLGIPFSAILTPFSREQLTPAEIRAAARRYLPSDNYVHLTAVPKDSTLYTRADSVTTATVKAMGRS